MFRCTVMHTLHRVVSVFVFTALLCLGAPAHGQGMGSFISPGPLSHHHVDLDTALGCGNCHVAMGGKPTTLCYESCHDTVRTQLEERTGFHGQGDRSKCFECHAEHRGRDNDLIDTTEFEANFTNRDHLNETGFPLDGAHRVLRCRQCHQTPGEYTGLDSACISCHEDPHGSAVSRRDVLKNCDTCHDAADWDALPLAADIFDHNARSQADYPLEGAHVDVSCKECHIEYKFVPVAFEVCTDCHINPHRAPFKDDPCEECHPSEETWAVEKFKHDQTGYRLEGLHRKVECEECHTTSDKTAQLSRRCEGCHADPHRGQFRPKDCDECHSVDVAAFAMREFDHDVTEFPLVGQHVEVECEECHDDGSKGVYVGLNFEDCDSCHEDAHEGRFEPTACDRCHLPDGFDVQFFDHDSTSFPHTGSHIGLDCSKCHLDSQWNDIPHESCIDCHYTKNPHRPVITGDMCEDCHRTTEFVDIQFDHAASTDFDLAPAHSARECTDCHTFIFHFAGLDANCTACHLDDRPFGHYDGECSTCHESERWSPGGLGGRGHEITGFALAGAHSVLPCESCHDPGRPRGQVSSGCASCHAADDPHFNMLGTACADCHGEVSWLRTSFRHNLTGWPLRGAHRLAACVDCHAAGYVGTARECFRCHDFQATPDRQEHLGPNRQSCERCHRVYQWVPAIYPH